MQVLSINYRSGVGYGRDYRLCGPPSDGPSRRCGIGGALEYDDVRAGRAWLDIRATCLGARGGATLVVERVRRVVVRSWPGAGLQLDVVEVERQSWRGASSGCGGHRSQQRLPREIRTTIYSLASRY